MKFKDLKCGDFFTTKENIFAKTLIYMKSPRFFDWKNRNAHYYCSMGSCLYIELTGYFEDDQEVEKIENIKRFDEEREKTLKAIKNRYKNGFIV